MTTHEPSLQDALDDDRPIALRRHKRRVSMMAPGSTSKNDTAATSVQLRQDANTTPSKPKKRVRFSDPGPLIPLMEGSTGITPLVNRTTLGIRSSSPSSPRPLARAPKRRQSLPVFSSTAYASMLSLPIEVQFAPLRQILDPRVRRRLKRNHLSEEINSIEAERRLAAKQDQEIAKLKEALELARQFGAESAGRSGDDSSNEQRIRELENEISMLRQEARGRSPTAEFEPATPSDEDSVMLEMDVPEIYQDDDYVGNMTVDAGSSPSRPKVHASASAVTQTVLDGNALSTLEAQIATQTGHLVHARLELEYLCPGETTLGLGCSNGDSQPVLDAFLSRLQALQAQLAGSNSALSASQAQEANLRTQFNGSLRQLEAARALMTELTAESAASTSAHVDARIRIDDLEASIDEKERSVTKLQTALDACRNEVRDMETLVGRMEAEHATTLSDLAGTHAQATDDLLFRIADETRGRREAEEECRAHLSRIAELDGLEKELARSVSDKQATIRGLETDVQEARQGREQEVGGLNARLSDVYAKLSVARIELTRAEGERRRLVGRVEEEKAKGLEAVVRMREIARRCWEGIGSAEEGYMKEAAGRGEETKEARGLLTPGLEGGKFRDAVVEGHVQGEVELLRGKGAKKTRRKLDSGVDFGIWEEDEEGEKEE